MKIYATRSVSAAMPAMSPLNPTTAFSQLVLMNNLINLVSNERMSHNNDCILAKIAWFAAGTGPGTRRGRLLLICFCSSSLRLRSSAIASCC